MSLLTPTYRLPYLTRGEVLSSNVEKIRFNTIDRQLEALFTFIGDGIISGWDLSIDDENNTKLNLSPGSGVIASVAAATTAIVLIDGLTAGVKNYIFAKLTGTTAYTAQAEFLASTVSFDSNVYLCLGTVTPNANGVITLASISTEGRKDLTLIKQILNIVSQHVHTGAPGEPNKIDLFNHVKGVLSAANIEDLSASKITSGIIDKNRFRLSHDDLKDIGTLSHADLDSLVGHLQSINKILFGDIATSNLIQLFISMKHIFADIDEYAINFAAVIPGIGNCTQLNPSSFIDESATTASIDYVNHRISGQYFESEDLGQVTINTPDEFKTGTYDQNYISIVDTAMAYGYGYGYGAGMDYFNVLEVNSGSFFEGTDAFTAFPGSNFGYGVSDPSGEFDFETWHPAIHPYDIEVFPYAYGYGWEYANGFESTLTSTVVTLKPVSASLIIHNKSDAAGGDNVYLQDIGDDSLFSPFISETEADQLEFLAQASNNATLDDRRSSNLNAADSQPADMYSFLSSMLYNDTVNKDIYQINDKAIVYTSWDTPLDMSEDNYLYFVLKQQAVPETGSTKYDDNFQSDWTFDHKMDLYIEVTDETSGIRYFYRYVGPSGTSTTRFFDDEINYFQDGLYLMDSPVNDVTPARIIISAQFIEGNVEFLGGYEIEATKLSEDNGATIIESTDTAPVFSDMQKLVTGVYLYASNESNFNFSRNKDAGPIYFPQGRKENLSTQVDGDLTKMLVELDEIYISSSFGYSDNIAKNQISDIEVSFPDNVDFNSLSWISEEPSDSLIYLQVKRGEGSYLTYPVFANKGTELNAKQITGFTYVNPSSATYTEDLADTYLVSGSPLPDEFRSIKTISLKVVLLPTSDKQLAPSLSSITVNYSSQTQSGSFTISAKTDWENVREQNNLVLTTVNGHGRISLLDHSRTKNVILGTYGKVMEYDSDWTTRKSYTGSNLPKTVKQELENRSAQFAGYITDLKVLQNGDIAVLDRDASRIVICQTDTDEIYRPKTIIASEYAYENVIAGVDASATGELVKVIYNRELGTNGVLYLVFSHELKAWSSGAVVSGSGKNVDPTKFLIRRGAIVHDLSSCEVIVCDRGILCFVLTSALSSVIENNALPILDMNFDPTVTSTDEYTAGDDSCVLFKNNIPVNSESIIEKEIVKVGEANGISGVNDYNLIYMPIQGIVAFDVDVNDNFVILKKSKPYNWDTIAEIWYAKFGISSYWSGWDETSDNFTSGSIYAQEPVFELNNEFGAKGSIEMRDDFLLIAIGGFKNHGVYVFRKISSTGTTLYSLPQLISLEDDGTYPMSARFDPLSYDSDTPAYGSIYVALSSLKNNIPSVGKMSKVIKVSIDGTVVDWQWGEVDTYGWALTVNDCRPLVYNDDSETSSYDNYESAIIST